MVGAVGVGGDNPIRVQSMTTTLTDDIEGTVAQAERLVRAGCEIVRVTTPTPDDSRCLKDIRERLKSRGIDVPLVADIHFSPMAAMVAADYADKVRVNPGNYVDSRKFAVREYTDAQYQSEIERAAERFTPLVLKCKERGIAMRIGTNHGSLSDRIMNRFGDTPEGMVESALEFVNVCEAHGYHDIILSMKASNPKVMIAAYRLLAARMGELGMDYPFHLGVTEAGNAEDGRIKSAVGIGSLLEDGIGDTIRVSLTEEPEAEIPVAFAIARRYPKPEGNGLATPIEPTWDPYHYTRRRSSIVSLGGTRLGGSESPAVAAAFEPDEDGQGKLLPVLLRWASPAGRRRPKPEAAVVHVAGSDDADHLRGAASHMRSFPMARLEVIARGPDPEVLLPAVDFADAVMLETTGAPLNGPSYAALIERVSESEKVLIVSARPVSGSEPGPSVAEAVERLRNAAARASRTCTTVVTLDVDDEDAIHAYRLLVTAMVGESLECPILLQSRTPAADGTEHLLAPSIQIGSLLCDGIGDAVLITGPGDTVVLTFNILQAAGARISKTDYVACPSCGRTLFDLQETTERIKSRTSHLVGVKLAIMGCIVNGPGEMADADFGYVGGAPGKVNLYVGKECVEKGVPAAEADDRLIELIKARGKWHEDDESVDEPTRAEVTTTP
jgi:(E)-4-hydroxy-3-methylbut-2-enyl-diphosphate synthase